MIDDWSYLRKIPEFEPDFAARDQILGEIINFPEYRAYCDILYDRLVGINDRLSRAANVIPKNLEDSVK